MNTLRVAVIGGGANCEHEVSLASAAAAAAALKRTGHDVVPLTIDPHGIWRDRGEHPIGLAGAAHVLASCDVVWPMVHGPHGEDGTLAALCDLAGKPWVGSSLTAGALAMDKWATKLVAESVGIGTAPGTLLTRGTPYTWQQPVVVKPVAAGSSYGVTLVDHEATLEAALEKAFAIDHRVLVEQVVTGREIDVAVLGRADGDRHVPPLLEILGGGIFDLATKYNGSARFDVPAGLSDAQGKELADAAVAMYDALGCRGLARVDFFLTCEGLVLNEVNTMPGFTPHSQAPLMFVADGIDYDTLVDLLVREAVASARGAVGWHDPRQEAKLSKEGA